MMNDSTTEFIHPGNLSSLLPGVAALKKTIDDHPLVVVPETPLRKVILQMNQGSEHRKIAPQSSEPNGAAGQRVNYVLVMVYQQLLGIFTERDVVRLSAQGIDFASVTIAEVMTRQLITLKVSEFETVFTALNLFRQYHIRHLPLLDDHSELVGVITTEGLRKSLQPNTLLKMSSVREVMSTHAITASPSSSIIEVAHLMTTHQISCVVIVQSKEQDSNSVLHPIGIITERDIVQLQTLELNLNSFEAHSVMSSPLVCLSPGEPLLKASQTMQQLQVRRLVVTDEQGSLAGILTQTNMLAVLNLSEIYSTVEILQQQVKQLQAEKVQILQTFNMDSVHQNHLDTVATQTYQKRSQESEQRFRLAFEEAAIGMALIAPDGSWLRVNRAICSIVGYSETELLKTDFQAITHPDDLESDLNYVQQMLSGEIGTYQLEKRYVHKQGYVVWVLLSVSLVRDQQDQPLYFISQIQDNTERKEFEQALRCMNEQLELAVKERTSELEQAYSQLKNSEAEYQDLYDNAPDMYVSVEDKSQKIIRCNQTLLNELGYRKQEVLGHSIHKIYHPDYLSMVERSNQSNREIGAANNAQLALQRQDGSKLEVSLNIQAVYDNDGNVINNRLSFRDITVHKQLEVQLQQVNAELEHRVQKRTKKLQAANQSLKKNQEKLELSLEASGGGWCHWKIPTGNWYWSPRLYRMLGYDVDELEPCYENWESLIHPDDLPRTRGILHAHLADSSVPYVYNYRLLTKSGEWKWIANFGRVVERDADNQPVRMVCMHHDISDRKQAEAERLRADEVRQELKLLEQIFKVVLAGYWDWDIPNQLEYLSPSFKRMLGYEDHELPNTPESWQNKIFPEDLPKVLTCLERHVQSQGKIPFYNEVRYRHKDGSTVWVIKSGQVIEWDTAGLPLRMIGCDINISGRKQAEKRIQQYAAQLEVSNRELEAFAYSVSHDLRTPLRAIDGFSKALLEDYGENFEEEAKDYFNRIRKNVFRMGLLIDDLLSLSRVSRSDICYTTINLSTLAQEVIHQLQESEPDRQVELQIAPDKTVFADATLMRVVLTNLLENAWKFTRHHPTARIEFGVIEHNGQLTYFVRDDGAGFDMTYVDKLFGVFQRLHSTHEFPGTGIGLASVQRAIHRHGGNVWAEAALEQGATFYFTLPPCTTQK